MHAADLTAAISCGDFLPSCSAFHAAPEAREKVTLWVAR